MVICEKCNREFKNNYSLANHTKHGCESKRLAKKLCNNYGNYDKCKQYYVHSKSGYCKNCSSKLNFNDTRSGKTYEELYGYEHAQLLKSNQTQRLYERYATDEYKLFGTDNPNFGKKCINNGKSWEEIHGVERAEKMRDEYRERMVGLFDENSIYIKSVLERKNITYEQYLTLKSEFEIYKYKVIRVTRQQPIQMLENHNKRGLHNYHLDHIVSIKVGYLNKIDPEIIGNIKNLRFIPSNQNLKKSSACEDGMLQYLIEEVL